MKDDELANALARRIWEERAVIHREDERDQPHSPDVPDTTLRLMEGIVLRISRMPWRVRVDMAGHRQDLEYYCATKVVHAWRAAQAAGILIEMGDAADADTVILGEHGPMCRLKAVLGIAPRPRFENVLVRLDMLLADRVERGLTRRIDQSYRSCTLHGEPFDAEITWHDAGDGVLFSRQTRFTLDGGERYLSVMHPTWGTFEIPSSRTERALKERRDRAHAGVLAHRPPVALPPPPSGNARIARVARLCQRAMALDPDLTDGNGAPIRPLVERHLPELLRIHAEAAATAPAERLAEVDADLERGVETIRRAVEEALLLLHDQRRDELATQLRFLETRHPTEV